MLHQSVECLMCWPIEALFEHIAVLHQPARKANANSCRREQWWVLDTKSRPQKGKVEINGAKIPQT